MKDTLTTLTNMKYTAMKGTFMRRKAIKLLTAMKSS